MKSTNATLRDKILDWFECNAAAKARSAPLAKALKEDPAKIAGELARMAEPGGDLVRCKVIVPAADRSPKAPAEQWEYALASGTAPGQVKPYVPPTVGRRATGPAAPSRDSYIEASTLAGGGANNPGSQPSCSSMATSSGEGLAVEQPAAEQSAPAADETPCCNAAKVMAITAQEVGGELREQLRLAEQQRDAHFSALEDCQEQLKEAAAWVAQHRAEAEEATQALELGTEAAREAIQRLEDKVAALKQEMEFAWATCDHHEVTIHDLQAKLTAANTFPFYVSIGRDKGPQIHKDFALAHRRARSLVRNGDKAGLVLVPLGKFVQGAEWQEVRK